MLWNYTSRKLRSYDCFGCVSGAESCGNLSSLCGNICFLCRRQVPCQPAVSLTPALSLFRTGQGAVWRVCQRSSCVLLEVQRDSFYGIFQKTPNDFPMSLSHARSDFHQRDKNHPIYHFLQGRSQTSPNRKGLLGTLMGWCMTHTPNSSLMAQAHGVASRYGFCLTRMIQNS